MENNKSLDINGKVIKDEFPKKTESTFLKKVKKLFKNDETIGVSKIPLLFTEIILSLDRCNFGKDIWTEIFTHNELWGNLPGVAYAFWGAFTTLAILGLIHPLKMIPLILVQLFYKLIWLFIVAYPLWISDQLVGSYADAMTTIMFRGFIADIIIIPWPYVIKNYVLFNRVKK